MLLWQNKTKIVFFCFRMIVELAFLISILLVNPALCSQLIISEEESQTGIIITPFNKINVRESVVHLAYSFDVSSTNYILNWNDNIGTVYSNIKTVCNQRSTIVTPLEIEKQNIKWNTLRPVPNNMTHVKNLNMTLFHNAIITANIESFNKANDETHECLHLTRIVQNFVQMNRILNELVTLNISTIGEIISLEHLLMDVKMFLRGLNKQNLIYPFDFSNAFSTSFFKHTKFSFYFNNYTVTLMFDIPLE